MADDSLEITARDPSEASTAGDDGLSPTASLPDDGVYPISPHARVPPPGAPADPGTFGRFRLAGELGQGGMAEVHLAVERLPSGRHRACVLKRPRPDRGLDDEVLALFAEEARILGLLAHPSVVRLIGAGEIDGVPYLALELVDGLSVEELLGPPLPLAGVAELGLGALAALEAVHGLTDLAGRALGLVHRDVSPDNLALDRDGRVKLLDFGIARFEGRRWQTTPGFVRGKLGYMPPEQLAGRAIDARADLFALGVVLVELATGPFPAPSSPTEAAARPADVARRLARSSLPAPFARFLAGLTAREVEARFASAAEARRALAATGLARPTALAAEVTRRLAGRAPLTDPTLDATGLAPWLGSFLERRAETKARLATPPPPARRRPLGWIALVALAVAGAVFLVLRILAAGDGR